MISIIVPVYNVEQYLEKTITSVLEQTYRDWELILVNDGSTDNSLQICRRFEKRERRIRVIDKKNGGVSSARNLGIEKAEGEWIAFLDGDDWLERECLKRIMCEVDDATDIVSWNYWRDSRKGNKKNKAIVPDKIVVETPVDLVKITMFPQYSEKIQGQCFSGIKGVCTKLIRRALIEKHSLRFNERLQIGEDAFFSMSCFEKARKVIFVNQYLYHYRQDNASATRKYRPDIEKVFQSTLHVFYDAVQIYTDEETGTCYGGLTYACVARAMDKKYFHPDCPMPLRECLKNLKGFISSERVQKGIAGINNMGVFSIKQKAVIYCVRYHFVFGLYILYGLKKLVKKS